MASQPTTPARNKALLRAYEPVVSLNKAKKTPLFPEGGTLEGGRLTSQNYKDSLILGQYSCFWFP